MCHASPMRNLTSKSKSLARISIRRRGGPGPQPGRGAAGIEIRASEKI